MCATSAVRAYLCLQSSRLSPSGTRFDRALRRTLIATAHACVDYRQLAAWARLIVDTRNAMNGIATAVPVVKS
jgi:hypothetical protein